jgi:ectoine hydroxylase-related dioxygenase (phytanoyl-CoA dioxygenase family)
VQPPLLGPALGFNMGWFLDDVTAANGGTLLVPGSNQDGYLHNPHDPQGTVAAEGPAGTVLIWDTKIWHGTGANTSTVPRHVLLLCLYRFYLRTGENYALSLRSDVYERASDRARTMLGFRCSGNLGGVEGLAWDRIVSRPANPLGQLKPTTTNG